MRSREDSPPGAACEQSARHGLSAGEASPGGAPAGMAGKELPLLEHPESSSRLYRAAGARPFRGCLGLLLGPQPKGAAAPCRAPVPVNCHATAGDGTHLCGARALRAAVAT